MAVVAVILSLLFLTTLTLGQPKNVLFFSIDDLRPEIGAYGASYMKTPNIDALASKSILFERAYCQVAVCSPSRASLLTGRRPDTNHVWRISDNEYWRTVPDATNATTIPQYFKEQGYISIGMGKIFHPGNPGGNNDELYSWSPEGLPYFTPRDRRNTLSAGGVAWYSFDGYTDNQLADGMTADNAINVLRELKQNKTNNGDERPFFLAVGLSKPHLPFYAPSSYYDLYPPASEIALPEYPNAPEGMPEIAWGNSGELRGYAGLESIDTNPCNRVATPSINSTACRVSTNMTRELRRGYYATVSFIDAQIGKIMTELETQGFGDDTVIVFWGDHGWQLGEHNLWSKNTNFEIATRVPFMIRVPGMTDNGIRTKALVELIDIFPSITELAGIDVPPMCTEDSPVSIACVEGSSVARLLSDPDQQWKKGSFSQYPRPSGGLASIPGFPDFTNGESNENVMGYSIRTAQYRFTEWYRFNRTISQANYSEIWGTELYDHTNQTATFNNENINLAFKPEMAATVTEFRSMLQAGWRDALPPPQASPTATPSISTTGVTSVFPHLIMTLTLVGLLLFALTIF